MRLAFATKADLPRGAEDDRAVQGPLTDRGIEVAPCVWDDPSIRWEGFDGVIVRSTWDYHLRLDAFLEWARRVDDACGIWNVPEVLRWNSHKAYLLELERREVPVVPTRLCSGVPQALEQLARESWPRAVVKPAVSAGGYRTYLVERREGTVGPMPWLAAPPEGEVLVQPYLEEVERSGERSLVYFAGRFSHAFLRAPHLASGSRLREGEPIAPSEAELRLGEAAIRAGPPQTLYARVDMVPHGPSGLPCVMELELIEPYLGLRSDTGAAERFADAIERAVRR